MTNSNDNQCHLTPLNPMVEASSGENAVCVYEPTRLAVKIDLIPIQFALNDIPENEDSFVPLESWPFEDRHMLADGLSQALVVVSLVIVDEDGVPEIENERVSIFQNEEAVSGDIVIGFEVEMLGVFSYGDQRDQAAVTIPFEELTCGRTGRQPDDPNALLFKTTTNIGETSIFTELILHSHEDQFQVSAISPAALLLATEEPFWLRPGEVVGSRVLSTRSNDGLDITKLQWHLRRFGFVNYRTRSRGTQSNTSQWHNIRAIGIDGDLGGSTLQCLEDFQRVARTPLRNRQNNNVEVSFTQEISQSADEPVLAEIAVWNEHNYTVDQHHGRAWLNHTDNVGTLNQDATIHYGVLIVDGNPVGHLTVQNTVGETRCLHGQRDFVYAESIRSAIRLFLEGDLVFRLHDADPGNRLGSTRLYGPFRDEVIDLLRDIRRQQEADYGVGTNRDVGVSAGYRDAAAQNLLLASGNSNAAGGQSWHNYGLAADIVFFNSRGAFAWCHTYLANSNNCSVEWNWTPLGTLSVQHGFTWGGNWQNFIDRPHHQLPAQNSPSQVVQDTYTNTQGTVEQKLQAVWNLMYP